MSDDTKKEKLPPGTHELAQAVFLQLCTREDLKEGPEVAERAYALARAFLEHRSKLSGPKRSIGF